MQRNGFTFLEMLVAIAMLAILAAMTLPSWIEFVERNRALVNVKRLVDEIRFAQGVAVARGEKIRLCKSSDGVVCGDSNVSWNDGQIVKVVGGKVLHVFSGFSKEDAITWQASLTRQDFLDFMPNGSTNGIQGSFSYWPDKERNAAKVGSYVIKINFNGRIAVSDKF